MEAFAAFTGDEDKISFSSRQPKTYRVNGIGEGKGDSSSECDKWIISAFKNSEDPNDEFNQNIFAKVYIISTSSLGGESRRLYLPSQGISYEKRVYENIISSLLENNECPHFLKFYEDGKRDDGSGGGFFEPFSSSHLEFKDLCNFLTCERNKEKFSGEANLIRNIQYICGRVKNCPPIHEDGHKNRLFKSLTEKKRKELSPDNIKKFTFGVTKLQCINPKTTQSFLDWWFFNKFEVDRHFLTILFQILWTCSAMSSKGLVHNDLHINNIWIEDLGIPKTFEYTALVPSEGENGGGYDFDFDERTLSTTFLKVKKFYVTYRYKVYVYDFDLSYSETLGENKILNTKDKISRLQTNTFVENLDFVKIMSYVVGLLSPSSSKIRYENLQYFFMAILLKKQSSYFLENKDKDQTGSEKTTIEKIANVFNNGFFFVDPRTKKSATQQDFFDKLNSPFRALNILYEIIFNEEDKKRFFSLNDGNNGSSNKFKMVFNKRSSRGFSSFSPEEYENIKKFRDYWISYETEVVLPSIIKNLKSEREQILKGKQEENPYISWILDKYPPSSFLPGEIVLEFTKMLQDDIEIYKNHIYIGCDFEKIQKEVRNVRDKSSSINSFDNVFLPLALLINSFSIHLNDCELGFIAASGLDYLDEEGVKLKKFENYFSQNVTNFSKFFEKLVQRIPDKLKACGILSK